MANILVAGGAGFIGSHTLLALKDAGHTLVALDDLSNGHADSVLAGELITGNLSDADLLDKVMQDYRIEAVVHFAAFIESGASTAAPLTYYENNVGGSLSLIQAMVRNGIRPIVFSSTAAVYGQRDDAATLSEDMPKNPLSPYGHSKWMVECMLQDTVATGAIDAIALRYFNAAGSDPEGRIGERHDPETHLIPLVLDAARGARPDIKIFGTDYATPDGTCVRDYIHVSDLAAAHVLALQSLLEKQGLDETNPGTGSGFYDAFNLGTSNGYSVREVIEAAKKITGVDFPVIEEARRPGDPACLVADARRAGEELGWSPDRSDLETIIEDAWRFRKTLAQ